MASDTGTLDLTRVAAERRRLEEEAREAVREHEVEHPAVVAQRIVDEVLRRAEETQGDDVAVVHEDVSEDPDDSGAIARRIVAEVLHDEDAIHRAARAAAEVTARHEAEAAAAEIRATAPESPVEERTTDRVYLVLPGDDGPLVLFPGAVVDPDTRPYVPAAHPDLDVRGSDGAALVERALAPLTRRTTWQQLAAAAEPHRGPTQYIAWVALVGMWLAAMAALVPIMFQSAERSIDATMPDFWDESAVVEDGAAAGQDLGTEGASDDPLAP